MGKDSGGGGTTTTTYPPPIPPAGYDFARQFFASTLPSLMGGRQPTYPRNIDPGLSQTMQTALRMGQGYAASPAPASLGQAGGALGRYMNPQMSGAGWGTSQGRPSFMNMPQPQTRPQYPGSYNPWMNSGGYGPMSGAGSGTYGGNPWMNSGGGGGGQHYPPGPFGGGVGPYGGNMMPWAWQWGNPSAGPPGGPPPGTDPPQPDTKPPGNQIGPDGGPVSDPSGLQNGTGGGNILGPPIPADTKPPIPMPEPGGGPQSWADLAPNTNPISPGGLPIMDPGPTPMPEPGGTYPGFRVNPITAGGNPTGPTEPGGSGFWKINHGGNPIQPGGLPIKSNIFGQKPTPMPEPGGNYVPPDPMKAEYGGAPYIGTNMPWMTGPPPGTDPPQPDPRSWTDVFAQQGGGVVGSDPGPNRLGMNLPYTSGSNPAAEAWRGQMTRGNWQPGMSPFGGGGSGGFGYPSWLGGQGMGMQQQPPPWFQMPRRY